MLGAALIETILLMEAIALSDAVVGAEAETSAVGVVLPQLQGVEVELESALKEGTSAVGETCGDPLAGEGEELENTLGVRSAEAEVVREAWAVVEAQSVGMLEGEGEGVAQEEDVCAKEGREDAEPGGAAVPLAGGEALNLALTEAGAVGDWEGKVEELPPPPPVTVAEPECDFEAAFVELPAAL